MSATPYITARVATGLTGLAVVSPVAGIAAEVCLAWCFGASPTVDAFRIATLLLFFGQQVFVFQILPHAIVPVFTEYRVQGQEKEAWRVAFSVANLLLVPALLVSLVAFVRPDAVVQVFAPGLTGEARLAARLFVRWFLLTYGVMVWSGVASGILYAHRIFWLPPTVQLVGNLTLAAAILSLGRKLGAASLVIGMLLPTALGAALYATRLLPLMRSAGAHFSWAVDLNHPGVRKTLKLALPLVGSIVVTQWMAIVVNRALSTLPPGTLARFGYTWKLGQLVSLLPVALATVLFPRFADAHYSPATGEFRDLCTRALRMAMFMTIPLTCLLYALRLPVVALLFERGGFTAGASQGVAELFGLLLLGAPASAAVFYMEKMSYAVQQTRLPLYAQLAGAGVVTLFSRHAALHMGAAGLMLLVGALLVWLNAAILLFALQRSTHAVAGKNIARFAVGILLPALISAGVAHLTASALKRSVEPGMLANALATTAGMVTGGLLFFGAAIALRLPEAIEWQNYLRWQGNATAKRLQEFVFGRT